MKPDRRVTRPWVLKVASVLLGGLAAVLFMRFVPAVEHAVGPAEISAKGVTGAGRTNLLIPPIGTVEVDTHLGPLSVNLSLKEIDIQRLAARLQEPAGAERLAGDIEEDLSALARRLAVRLALGGLVLGGIGLALLPHRRRPYIIGGAAGGLAGMALLISIAATTFSVDAFEEPTFTGALERAPVVIEALNKNEISIPEVRSRLEIGATRLTDLLALLAEPDLDPRADSTALLHISDIHSNPIGLEIARQLANRFEVDAVLDTGDLTNFGVALETRIADLVDGFDLPYIFVPGNHDSTAVVAAMSRLENVTVLDGDVTELDGVTILGLRDPTYSNWNAIEPEAAAEVRREYAATVAESVRGAAPDVLAVHDRRIAEESIGLVPLILSGHYHKRIMEDDRGTRMLAVGTTGASGLKSFTLEADIEYEAEILYFRAGEAVAVDYIRFEGLASNFVIERTVLGPLGDLEPPPSPSPTPTP